MDGLAEKPGGSIAIQAFDGLDGPAALRLALTDIFAGRIAVLSSFGADSALLLSMVAEIDPATPILFLQTGRHFPETLAYRQTLTRALGLTDTRDLHPDPDEAASEDPDADLYLAPDSCCALRKTRPLALASRPFAALVTGRRRDQASTRAGLNIIERDGARIKLNPLAGWTSARIVAEIERRGLLRHPLSARGYLSIGCAPCTDPVSPGGDARSGRWAGRGKVECGIHRPVTSEARA